MGVIAPFGSIWSKEFSRVIIWHHSGDAVLHLRKRRALYEILKIPRSVLGSPDKYGRQLDGMGGGISSLSKVCVVGPSSHPDADVDYTFAAVGARGGEVDMGGACGNMYVYRDFFL